jgi:hypothetical protein
LAVVHDAIRGGTPVWLEFVDGNGEPVRRRVKPLRLDGGRLRALDPERETELTVAVHRIVSTSPDTHSTHHSAEVEK